MDHYNYISAMKNMKRRYRRMGKIKRLFGWI